jgi:hypothetical protein
MEFVLAANAGGYDPQADELREWLDRPDPQPGRKGKLLRPAEPPTPSPFMAQIWSQVNADQKFKLAGVLAQNQEALKAATSSLTGIAQMYAANPGRPAEYEPDDPPEHTVEHLLRLRWLRSNESGSGLKVTPLGRALYDSDVLDRLGYGDDKEVIVLGAGEEFAWGKLVSHISELGECLVIDPYLRNEQLTTLKTHTTMTRALIGSGRSTADCVALKVTLGALGYEHIELRQAPPKTLHDRYVISADAVYMMGGSLNGVGAATTTTLMPLTGEPALRIRQLAEEWWEKSVDLRMPD